DFAPIFGEGALQQLHRAGGDDSHVAEGRRRADGLSGAVHFRQTAAIRADGGEQVIFPLQFYAAQRVATTFVIGCKEGAADQLAEEARGELVLTLVAELGDGGKVLRVFGGQLELAALAADLRATLAGFDAEGGIGAFTED